MNKYKIIEDKNQNRLIKIGNKTMLKIEEKDWSQFVLQVLSSDIRHNKKCLEQMRKEHDESILDKLPLKRPKMGLTLE